MLAIPARVIATSFALTCFAATLCYGIYNGNNWLSILGSAFLVALISLLVGSLVGWLALRTVNEHINRHREANPIPDDSELNQPDPAAAPAG